ncbi:MAG: hypothetical protein Q8M29_04655 [Bacteroidota bacterium]|nr:hypothetical protein [Bacteroidota bacterium]
MRSFFIQRILLFLLMISSPYVYGQTKIKEQYLDKMPPIDKVLQSIQGADELDTKAKQSAACELLYDFICTIADQKPKAKNQGSNLWLTDEEKKLNAMYSGTSTKIIMEVYEELESDKKERFKEGSPCMEWKNKRDSYMANLTFIETILNQFVPPNLAQQYIKIKKKRIDEYHASPEYKSDLKVREKALASNERSKNIKTATTAFYIKKYLTIFGIALFLIVLLPWINYFRNKSMELTKDKLIIRRKEFNIYSITGVIVDSSKTSTTHSYTSGGGYNSSTNTYTAPTTHYSTTIHDQLFLVDKNGGEHPVQLSGWNLAVRPGHTLTMLWAVKKGDSRGPYLMALNHTTNLKYSMTHLIHKIFAKKWSWLFTFTFFGLLALFTYIIVPYLQMTFNISTIDNFSKYKQSMDIALYFQVYCWTWGLYFIGLITNKVILGKAAAKRTQEFIDYFNVSDFK